MTKGDYEDLYGIIMWRLKALERKAVADARGNYYPVEEIKDDLLQLQETIAALDALVRNKTRAIYRELKKLPEERDTVYDIGRLWSESAGGRLRTIREKLGLTIDEAVKGVDVTAVTLKDWEDGFRAPQFTKLRHYADRYCVNLDWVLTEVGHPFSVCDMTNKNVPSNIKLAVLLQEQAERRGEWDKARA